MFLFQVDGNQLVGAWLMDVFVVFGHQTPGNQGGITSVFLPISKLCTIPCIYTIHCQDRINVRIWYLPPSSDWQRCWTLSLINQSWFPAGGGHSQLRISSSLHCNIVVLFSASHGSCQLHFKMCSSKKRDSETLQTGLCVCVPDILRAPWNWRTTIVDIVGKHFTGFLCVYLSYL